MVCNVRVVALRHPSEALPPQSKRQACFPYFFVRVFDGGSAMGGYGETGLSRMFLKRTFAPSRVS
jgi:hypothetical protein